MPKHDVDPRAPYKVYEGDELKGTYATRAEARVARKALCANGGADRFWRGTRVTDRRSRAARRRAGAITAQVRRNNLNGRPRSGP